MVLEGRSWLRNAQFWARSLWSGAGLHNRRLQGSRCENCSTTIGSRGLHSIYQLSHPTSALGRRRDPKRKKEMMDCVPSLDGFGFPSRIFCGEFSNTFRLLWRVPGWRIWNVVHGSAAGFAVRFPPPNSRKLQMKPGWRLFDGQVPKAWPKWSRFSRGLPLHHFEDPLTTVPGTVVTSCQPCSPFRTPSFFKGELPPPGYPRATPKVKVFLRRGSPVQSEWKTREEQSPKS